jgi:hypothetical protein
VNWFKKTTRSHKNEPIPAHRRHRIESDPSSLQEMGKRQTKQSLGPRELRIPGKSKEWGSRAREEFRQYPFRDRLRLLALRPHLLCAICNSRSAAAMATVFSRGGILIPLASAGA